MKAARAFTLSCSMLLICTTWAAASTCQVALTFDDLPSTGDAPPGMSSLNIARSILKILRKAHAPPTYGFVNAGTLTGSPEEIAVLKAWTASGNLLGNHTFSHLDLSSSTITEYEKDVVADEPVLQRFMDGKDWHWFRYPYLSEGDTPEKRSAVREYLQGHGYHVAQVTLDFGDYAWNDPYARCLAMHNGAAIAWLKTTYLEEARTSLDAGRATAKLAYGRDIPHVMLLHVGGIETAMLPKLLALLRREKFRLVALEEAERDPAYNLDPGVASKNGYTLIQQMIESRHLSAAPRSQEIFTRLDALCR